MAPGGKVGRGSLFLPLPLLLSLLTSPPRSPLPPCSSSSALLGGAGPAWAPTLPLFRILNAHCLTGTLRLKTMHIPAFPSWSWFHVNRQRGLLLLAYESLALPVQNRLGAFPTPRILALSLQGPCGTVLGTSPAHPRWGQGPSHHPLLLLPPPARPGSQRCCR